MARSDNGIGNWQIDPQPSLIANPDKFPEGHENGPGSSFLVGALYNAMIAPLRQFAIKGVAWYQGESNEANATQYRTLMPLLIAEWRA